MTNMSVTNRAALADFTRKLSAYETALPADKIPLSGYEDSAAILCDALSMLLMATVADGYAMMRIFADKVRQGSDTAYSQTNLLMLSAVSNVPRARTLIMTIVTCTRQTVLGETLDFRNSHLTLVDSTGVISAFLLSYPASDQAVIARSNPDQIIGLAKCDTDPIVTVDCTTSFTRIPLRGGAVRVTINNDFSPDQPLVIFHLADDFTPSDAPRPLVICNRVTVETTLTSFTISRQMQFSHAAVAQMRTLGCVPDSWFGDTDCSIVLPGLFYTAVLDVVSLDSGVTWDIVNVAMTYPQR